MNAGRWMRTLGGRLGFRSGMGLDPRGDPLAAAADSDRRPSLFLGF